MGGFRYIYTTGILPGTQHLALPLKMVQFKTLTPKDFRAPFPIELSPQENLLPRETSP